MALLRPKGPDVSVSPQPTACRSRRWPLPLVFLVLVGIAAPLDAQPAGGGSLEAEGGLGAFSVAGDDFPGIGAGPAVEAGLRTWLSPRLSVGAGLHHSWHSAPRLSASFRLLSLHLEPRLHLPHLSVVRAVHPFLGVRAGYARWEAREGSRRFRAEIRAGGLQASGVAGVAVPIRPGVALDVALEAGYLRFGDARVEADFEGSDSPRRVTPSGTGTAGVLLGVRSSLRASLPWP